MMSIPPITGNLPMEPLEACMIPYTKKNISAIQIMSPRNGIGKMEDTILPATAKMKRINP